MCVSCNQSLESVTYEGLKDYKKLHGFCRMFRKKLRVYQLKFGGKECSKCLKDLPFGDFPKHKKTYDGFDSWCKSCRKVYSYETVRSLDSFIRASYNRLRDDKRTLEKTVGLAYMVNLWHTQNGLCAISKVPMCFQRKLRKHNAFNGSLDRIDSSKGYVEGNLQWVCWNVNRMKGENDTSSLIFWCEKVLENKERLLI